MVARRRSGDTSTWVTVTKPTRGSFSRGISSARISRNSSATRSGRVPVAMTRPPPGLVASLSIIGAVQRQVHPDELDGGERPDVPFHRVHHLAQVVALAGDGGDADGRPLPQVLV